MKSTPKKRWLTRWEFPSRIYQGLKSELYASLKNSLKKLFDTDKIYTVIFLEQYRKILAVWLVIINFISAIVCIADKSRAKRGKWRVRESTLWVLTFLGGGAGMYLTMRLIRHKTLHKSFMIGIPLIVILQIIAVFCILYLK